MILEDGIRKLKAYVAGDGGYDELDFKEDILDNYIKKESIKALIEAAKILNLELHGREDCKNCALMEQLEEML